MELYCTRPTCPRPINHFSDLDDSATLKSVSQKYCTACGMPQILVGRYLPLKQLGRGGFGTAFLAIDRYTPMMRRCVVKQFQPSGTLNSDQLQIAQRLFEREAEVLENLGTRHPQIPNLLAFFELDVSSRTPGENEKFFYLVQEFIDGQDMEEGLEQTGRFSEEEVSQMLLAILDVLQFVHNNGSIHRDIKPSNIMRHRNGQYFLLDFGAVKQVTTAAAVAGQPAGRSTGIYSRGYAPPEQVSGSVVYPATDLYALAVTCITLLTGKQPHELFDPLSNSFNWHPYVQVSDCLKTVLDRLLLPAPNQRYQSAEEVIAALRSPVTSAPHSAPSPVPATVRSPTPSAPSPQIAKASPQPVAPAPSPPQPAPIVHQPLAPVPTRRPVFSLMEVLQGAAFTGFEGGILAIALVSLLGTSLTPGFWLILLAGVGALIFAQNRRWIEKIDLVIIAGISLALVIFVPFLNQAVAQSPLQTVVAVTGGAIPAILVVAIFTALLTVAITIVFRLIYNLLSRLL